MTNISPETVTELMYNQFDYFTPPASLSSTILQFAHKVDSQVSDLTIAENILAENIEKYISALVRKEQERREENLFCPYQVFPDRDEIVGFSYPRSTDSSIMEKVRRVAPEVCKALEIIRGLHHREFEFFCSRVLDLLHAEETFKTKDSNDEGVDFLGWLSIPESFSKMEKNLQFRREFRMLVLGQAKRYKPENPVGVSHVRELVGTVAAFHHDQLAPWESRLKLTSFTVMSPILPLIMTTGRISAPARLLAEKCGVVTRDGAEIALFICLEGVGISEVEENAVTRLKFDKQKFMQWLNQTKLPTDINS